MATDHEVKTVSGKRYRIREEGGYFYVSSPSWGFGRHQHGRTTSMATALAIIKNDAGEKISSVS